MYKKSNKILIKKMFLIILIFNKKKNLNNTIHLNKIRY